MRDFRVGDKVRFGVGHNGLPVWDVNTTHVGAVRYADGVVERAGTHYFWTTVRLDRGTSRVWCWRQPSSRVTQEMLNDPAYIRLVEDEESQPKPAPNDSQPIWEQVAEDLKERAEFGKEKYGTHLQAHNGRDASRDAYEEALDLVQYSKQQMIEMAELARNLKNTEINRDHWKGLRLDAVSELAALRIDLAACEKALAATEVGRDEWKRLFQKASDGLEKCRDRNSNLETDLAACERALAEAEAELDAWKKFGSLTKLNMADSLSRLMTLTTPRGESDDED